MKILHLSSLRGTGRSSTWLADCLRSLTLLTLLFISLPCLLSPFLSSARQEGGGCHHMVPHAWSVSVWSERRAGCPDAGESQLLASRTSYSVGYHQQASISLDAQSQAASDSARANANHDSSADPTGIDAQPASVSDSEAQSPRLSDIRRMGAHGADARSGRGSRRETRPSQSLYPASHLRSLVNGSFFLPHPSIPVNRGQSPTGSGRGSGSISGTCIAITSTPRHQRSGGVGYSWMQQAVREGGEEEMTWELVERLLHMLDDRRAKGRDATGRGERQRGDAGMWAVLHSSGCQVRLPAELDLSDGQAIERYVDKLTAMSPLHERSSVEELLAALERQQRLGLGRSADRHTRAVSDVAKGLSLETFVVPVDQQVCSLMQDAALLLRVVEPERVQEEGWEKWLWRTKLAVDFVYVMHQCLATRPKYILLLQDDTKPVRLWDIGIERFINRDLKGKEPWALLSLYHPDSFGFDTVHAQEYKLPCCAQALLFDASQVQPLLEHMEAEFMERPMDLNIKTYLENAEAQAYVHVPSLFQHEGEVRTTYMAASFHHDTSFDEDVVAKSILNKSVEQS